MLEKTIEGYLRDQVKKAGGKAYKFTSPGTDGVPDRLVCLPGGKVAFVEVKATGRKPTRLQIRRIEELQAMGFCAGWLDSKEEVDLMLKEGLLRGFPTP